MHKLKTEEEVQIALYQSYDTAHYNEMNKYFSESFKDMIHTDGFYRLLRTCSVRVTELLKKDKNRPSYLQLLGCSKDQLKSYLEEQFKPNMTWDNYGRKDGIESWELDHKIPCSAFNLNNVEEQKICFHYTNLQPLWHKENITKRNKIFSSLS